jgi:hypothetical protein
VIRINFLKSKPKESFMASFGFHLIIGNYGAGMPGAPGQNSNLLDCLPVKVAALGATGAGVAAGAVWTLSMANPQIHAQAVAAASVITGIAILALKGIEKAEEKTLEGFGRFACSLAASAGASHALSLKTGYPKLYVIFAAAWLSTFIFHTLISELRTRPSDVEYVAVRRNLDSNAPY